MADERRDQPEEKALPLQMSVEISWRDARLAELFAAEQRKLRAAGFELAPGEQLALRLLSRTPVVWMPNVLVNSADQMPLLVDPAQLILTNGTTVHYVDRCVPNFCTIDHRP